MKAKKSSVRGRVILGEMWHFSAEFQTRRLRRGHLGEYLEEVRKRVRQADMMLSEINLTKVLRGELPGRASSAHHCVCCVSDAVRRPLWQEQGKQGVQ